MNMKRISFSRLRPTCLWKRSAGLLLLILCCRLFVQAQSNQVTVRLLSNPTSNFLFLLPQAGQNLYQNVAYYRVLRAAQGRSNFREIGRLSFPKDYAVYRQQVGPSLDSLFRKQYQTEDGARLLDLVQRSPDNYFFYLISPELWRVNGWLLEDKDVKATTAYDYQLWRVNTDGSSAQVFAGTLQAGGRSALIKQYHMKQNRFEFRDSLITVGWSSVGATRPTGAQYLRFSRDSLYRSQLFDKLAQNDQERQKLLSQLPTSYDLLLQAPIQYALYKRRGGGAYQKLVEAYGVEEEGIFGFTWNDRVVPEQPYQYYIVPQDFLGNVGVPSDTALALSFDRNTIPRVQNVVGRDTTGGPLLTWTAPATKVYFQGVEVSRRLTENGPVDHADTLALTTTRYVDRTAIPYQGYYYRIKPILMPFAGRDSIKYMGTDVFVTYTHVPGPTPIQGLTARQEGPYVRLTWSLPDTNTLYGVYVFRGHTKTQLLPVSKALRTNTFLDTTSSLSGRSTYLYTLQAMNIDQTRSDFSDTVSIKPNRKITVPTPVGINANPAPNNESVLIQWTDMRQSDNAVVGYVLQRRLSNEQRFTVVSAQLIDSKSYVDTTILRGLTYEYRLASVSMSHDTSAFTYGVRVALPAAEAMTYQVRNFTARNTTQGVEIALPSIRVEGITGYRLYRRELGSTQPYQPLATLDAATTQYIDKQTVENRVYVYTVTAIDRGIESEKVEEKTVRRRLPGNLN